MTTSIKKQQDGKTHADQESIVTLNIPVWISRECGGVFTKDPGEAEVEIELYEAGRKIPSWGSFASRILDLGEIYE